MSGVSFHQSARAGGLVRLLGAALFFASGCTDDEVSSPPSCAADDRVGGVCAGVPPELVCDVDPCTSGLACSSTIAASDDASLGAAIASAGPGTCIALSAGSYGEASLPGGVSLLGRSAALVHVGKVTLGAGAGATLRGVHVGGGGLTLAGATGARIDAVRVSASAAEGIAALAGSSATVVGSTVEGSARHGLRLDDGASVAVVRTIVQGSEGPGIWAACGAGCGCAARPELSVETSIVRDNRLAGVALSGADASLTNVDVLRTNVGDTWHFGEGGGGLSVAACSNAEASAVRVHGSKSFGVLVDDSSAALGGPDTSEGIDIRDNLFGVFLQHIAASDPAASVAIENAMIVDNAGVGLGVGGASKGIIIICKTAVTGTTFATLPVYEGAMDLGTTKQVGDGFNWLEGSEASVEDLTLSGNARASLLIDGPASGILANVTLAGGDEQKGIVQQNYAGGDQPQMSGAVPPVQVLADEKHPVAKSPALVGAL